MKQERDDKLNETWVSGKPRRSGKGGLRRITKIIAREIISSCLYCQVNSGNIVFEQHSDKLLPINSRLS